MKFLLCAIIALFSAVASRAEEHTTFEVGPFAFHRPASWDWIEVNFPMRKAQLKVPGKDGNEAAEIVFFFFGSGQGGDAKANTDRWLHQFQSKPGADKVDSRDLGGAKVTLVSTEGTYQGGMPGAPSNPKEGYALIGAIMEHSDGNVFVKMTGPTASVNSAREQFVGFINTAAAAKK